MNMTVECDHCGKKVRLRRDDTYGVHSFRMFGDNHRCERSEKPYARHMGEFRIVARSPNQWLCECRCGETFLGASYENVEARWEAHTRAVTS